MIEIDFKITSNLKSPNMAITRMVSCKNAKAEIVTKNRGREVSCFTTRIPGCGTDPFFLSKNAGKIPNSMRLNSCYKLELFQEFVGKSFSSCTFHLNSCFFYYC